MKKISTNREILLQGDSKFFHRDWCELNNNVHDKKLSQKEQLIQLCWNGMLHEMIPELFVQEKEKKPLTLWEINDAGILLDLRYGDLDQLADDEFSINPYIFSKFAVLN
jgi:hypothetical protein